MNSPYRGKFRVSQQFKGAAHDGLDLVGVDSKLIYSTVEGVVEKAGWENPLNHKQGFGLYVRIKRNGSVDRYYFGHLSKLNVKKGQAVKIGDVLGTEGSTGKSTGSHCHYCVRGNCSKAEIRNINVLSGITNKLGTYTDERTTTDVFYQVWDDVKNAWLPEVKNDTDFAGIFGHDACGVSARLTKGNITYAVHLKGGSWLPEVRNKQDYAGLYNKPIDALMLKTDTGKQIKYRVHLRRKKKWLSWVTGYSKEDRKNGYAGVMGQEIDAIQIKF